MRHDAHSYKLATHGRAIQVDPKEKTRFAKIICEPCGFVGKVMMTTIMPPEIIDKKFVQRGWELDPHVCPSCVMARDKAKRINAHPEIVEAIESHEIPEVAPEIPVEAPAPIEPEVTKEEKAPPMPNVTTIPVPSSSLSDANVAALQAVSNNTHKATAIMHKLLTVRFNPEEGEYDEGWSDVRVANESGMSLDYVETTRKVAYGELKGNSEIEELRAEMQATAAAITELFAGAQKDVNDLVAKVDALALKLGVK